MARVRRTIVSLEDAPYYHCFSRVVSKDCFAVLIAQQVSIIKKDGMFKIAFMPSKRVTTFYQWHHFL